MCWNAEVSLGTFLFGLVSAIFLYVSKFSDFKALALVCSFTSMQLIEFLTWTYIDNERLNFAFSILGLLLIIVQIVLLNIFIPDDLIKQRCLLTLALFFIIFLATEVKNTKWKMEKGENGHLVWYWLDVPIVWIFISLFFYIFPVVFYKHSFGLIFLSITLFVSLYCYFQYKTWGSMWCWFSNFLWIFLLSAHFVNRMHKGDSRVQIPTEFV